MGNIGAKVVVKLLNNDTNYTGNELKGIIYLGVELVSIKATQLRISLIGEEETTVHYSETSEDVGEDGSKTSTTEYKTATESFQFFNYDACVHNFDDKVIVRGKYEFPFSINIPEKLPDSFTQPLSSISYKLKVHVIQPDNTTSELSHSINLKLIKQVTLKSTENTVYIGPQRGSLLYCCKWAGCILVGGKVDTTTMTPHDTIHFAYIIKNYSNVRISGLSILVYEKVITHAQGQKKESRKEIHRIHVPAKLIQNTQYGSAVSVDLKNFDFKQELNVTEQITTWKIPAQAMLADHHGRLIQISHEIEYLVHTQWCADNVTCNHNINYYTAVKRPLSDDNNTTTTDINNIHMISESEHSEIKNPLEPSAPLLLSEEDGLPTDWSTAGHVTKVDPVSLKIDLKTIKY